MPFSPIDEDATSADVVVEVDEVVVVESVVLAVSVQKERKK